MTGFIDRLGELTKIELEDLPYIEANASDPEKDKGGSASDLLALSYRFLAVSDYILKGDIISFRSNLIKASSIQNNLFDRFEKGEAIAPSLVTMLSYQALFNALASADWHLSEVLALKMGGREDIEKKVIDAIGEPTSSGDNLKMWELKGQRLVLEIPLTARYGYLHLLYQD